MEQSAYTFPDDCLNRFYELGADLMDSIRSEYDDCPLEVREAFDTLDAFHSENYAEPEKR